MLSLYALSSFTYTAHNSNLVFLVLSSYTILLFSVTWNCTVFIIHVFLQARYPSSCAKLISDCICSTANGFLNFSLRWNGCLLISGITIQIKQDHFTFLTLSASCTSIIFSPVDGFMAGNVLPLSELTNSLLINNWNRTVSKHPD